MDADDRLAALRAADLTGRDPRLPTRPSHLTASRAAAIDRREHDRNARSPPFDDERLPWAGRAVKSPIEAQSIQGGTRRSAFQGEHGKPRRVPATSATTLDSSESDTASRDGVIDRRARSIQGG